MQLTEHTTEGYHVSADQKSSYDVLFQCLWTNNSTTISDSNVFVENYFSDFCASLYSRETGILEKDGKIGIFSVPTIEYWNEAQLAELISAHTYKYPAIKLRTVAGILLHKNSQILDRFSLKEKVVIIGYIMGKSKTFLGDIYPDLDIQNCIDRLRNSIITR